VIGAVGHDAIADHLEPELTTPNLTEDFTCVDSDPVPDNIEFGLGHEIDQLKWIR